MKYDPSTLLFLSLALLECSSVTSFTLPHACKTRSHDVLDARAWLPKNPLPLDRRQPRSVVTTQVQPDTSLRALSGIAASVQTLHGNPSYVLTAILWLSTFGVSLERRTVIGKALSAPLATMALALTTANIGFLPFESPICKKNRED